MAKVTKSKILDAAQINFDAIEEKISAKVSTAAANKKNTSNEIDATTALANWKAQFKAPLFSGSSFTIPEKVYEAMAQKISSSLSKSLFNEKLSLSEGEQIKQIAAEISKILPKIAEEIVPVEENDTTINYKINFGWKNLGVITVQKGNSGATLQAKNSNNWNEAIAKYSVALQQLAADTIAYAKKEFRKALVTGAKNYLKILYGGTASEWAKITKNTAFKKISRDTAKKIVADFLENVNDSLTRTNIEKYGNLATLYKNLADAIGNRQSDTAIRKAAESFSDAAKSILGTSFVKLPDPADDFHYSANLSEVTIPAGAGKIIYSSDYESKVKKIDATAYTTRVTISGNTNANEIYGGSGVDILYGGAGKDTIHGGNGNDSLFGEDGVDKIFGDAGNDTLIGGAGNDCLTGGAGKDVFYHATGDGNDIIWDYTAGQDKIKIGSGTVSGYSVKSGKDGVLTIGNEKITLKGVGNSEITVVDATNATITFGGIAKGLSYNNDDLPKASAVTINSAYSGKTYLAGYSSIVTINSSARTGAIELVGNAKANKILGGKGADILNGGSGNDTLVGNAGNDTLIGGAGNDCLTGGAGNDVFYYAKGDGADVIADFSTGDKIYIDGADSVSGSLKNNAVTFKIGSGSIKLTGVKNLEVAIEYSNGSVGKYLNGALVSMSRTIPSDALRYNGHYYKIYNDGMTWSDAKTFCENLGGHLATITDANEQAVVANLLYEHGLKNAYWIGCKLNSANQMDWITNEDMIYSNWAEGEPDNYQGNQGYGFIEGKETSTRHFFGKWGDLQNDCNSWDGYYFWGANNFGLICEWDSGAVTGSSALFIDDNFIGDASLDSITEPKISVTNIQPENQIVAQDESFITYAEKN